MNGISPGVSRAFSPPENFWRSEIGTGRRHGPPPQGVTDRAIDRSVDRLDRRALGGAPLLQPGLLTVLEGRSADG
jgi:hypothetical protein